MLRRSVTRSAGQFGRRPGEPPGLLVPEQGPRKLRLDALCSICEATFDRVREGRRTFSWFHSIQQLVVSATEGCHFCNLIVGDMQSSTRRVSGGLSIENWSQMPAATEALKAETRHVPDFGVSFALRYADALDHDVLAAVEFLFEDVADDTRAFALSENTKSDSSWDQVLKWNSQCLNEHLACRLKSDNIPRSDYPTRLIYVGDITSNRIRLCETSKLDRPITFTTLSHCWGRHLPVRLLMDNYSSFLEGYELKDLPETFQDAVVTTRKLCINFLWIDSLCIIQDSDLDWSNESSKMHQIYKNSYLNLAAAVAKDSTEGFFHPRRPLHIVPCCVKVGQIEHARQLRSSYTVQNADSGRMILYTRAWVFQEWLLAPRTLIFGKNELLWECGKLNASEIYPHGYPVFMDRMQAVERLRLATLRNEWQKLYSKTSVERWDLWCEITSNYSARYLTRFSDKLVALSGLAADMAKGWKGMEYLAGLWSYRLRGGLLWRYTRSGKLFPRPACTTPSWSWGSIDRPVYTDCHHEFIDGLVEVLDASIQHLVPSNPYGAVTSGSIRIKAPMLKAKILKHSSKNLWKWYIMFTDDWREHMEDSEDSENMENPDSMALSDYMEDTGDPENMEILEEIDSNITPRTASKIRAGIILDDPTFEEVIEVASVFLVPFEISSLAVHKGLGLQGLALQGLILLPTFMHAGQFRRIGWFQVEDEWTVKDFSTAGNLPDYEDPFSRDSTPEEVELLDDCSQEPPKTADGRPWKPTVLDLREALSTLSARDAAQRKAGVYDVRLQKIQSFMEDLGVNVKGDDRPRRDDPYHNGVVNATLVDRYGADMQHVCPKINSFLTMTYMRFDFDRENSLLSEELYEENHGDGYFTFQIV